MSTTFMALGLMTLGGLVTTVGLSFADGNRATQTVVGSDLILPYDGYLMIDSTPFTGTRTLKFELFQAASGGTAVWTEEQPVSIYNGRFSAGLGTSTSLTATILDAEKLWLAMTVVDTNAQGMRTEIPLSGRQAIEPAPFAAWSANSADLQVAGDLDVDGSATIGSAATDVHTIRGNVTLNGPLKPGYSNWDATTGAGGAVIRNDNGLFKTLMIVGNDSAGAGTGVAGDRAINLYDDVTVGDDLTVVGDLTLGDDNDIYGADIIQGFNDLRLRADGTSGDTLVLRDDRITASEAVTINNSVDNDGSDAALVINSQMLIDNNEIDGTAGLFLQNNTNAGLTVGSNSTINGNLTVNGDITNFSVSQTSRSVTGNGTNNVQQSQVNLVSTGLQSGGTGTPNSICFLTEVNVIDHENNNQNRCLVHYSASQTVWQLTAFAKGGTATETRCQATCLSW